jgi:hypothetical protein
VREEEEKLGCEGRRNNGDGLCLGTLIIFTAGWENRGSDHLKTVTGAWKFILESRIKTPGCAGCEL